MLSVVICTVLFFFFNDTATTEIYTLSLHDALPIFLDDHINAKSDQLGPRVEDELITAPFKQQLYNAFSNADRKSTRLNSSHANISYAVFCLKKKNQLHADSQHRSVTRMYIVNPTTS